MSKNIVPYDFRKASVDDETAAAFKIWINKTSFAIADTWRELSNSPATIQLGGLNTETFGSATHGVDGTYVGAIIEFNNGANESIWALAPQDAQRLISELLGLPTDTELLDRPTTAMENDLCAMFFEYMTLSLADNFPGSEPIPGSLKEIVPNPKRVRLFRTSDSVTTVRLVLSLPRGDVSIQWILPRESTVAMMDGVIDQRTTRGSAGSGHKGNPQEIVERMKLEITGILGETTLSLNQLAKMKEGDVFVLNQKIDQPLVALIDGKPFYECWPGKLGNTQGLEICKCL